VAPPFSGIRRLYWTFQAQWRSAELILKCPPCILMMEARMWVKGIKIKCPLDGVGQQHVVSSDRVSADFTK